MTAGARRARSARGHDPARYEPAGEPERYDAVVATVPNDVFRGLLDDDLAAAIGPEYLGRLERIEYHTALCLLLELDRRFSPFYWTNIADPELPFVGLVEHTNFVEPERYDGRRFLYVANYLAPGDPLLELDADALLERYTPGLRKVNPGFDALMGQAALAAPRARRAADRHRRLSGADPAAARPACRSLVLANTTQIYPGGPRDELRRAAGRRRGARRCSRAT